jgi:hypothetical protein
VSARSDAWYAVSENRERRLKSVQAYSATLTEIGQRYYAERRIAYLAARRAGLGHTSAQSRAKAVVRDAHHDEFTAVLAEKRRAL